MILLDMEMPKRCWDCDLFDGVSCYATGTKCEDEWSYRNDDCPIKAEIPTGATNGDVFEAMFPWIKSEKDYENSIVAILVRGHKGYIHFDMEWWNSPWEGWK